MAGKAKNASTASEEKSSVSVIEVSEVPPMICGGEGQFVDVASVGAWVGIFQCQVEEIDHSGPLCRVESRPDSKGAWFFCIAYVDVFGWLDGSELVVFETMQTLFYLGHATVLVKSFPEVYG
ncbi:hypothetical protein CRG98_026421 [Punica granatum]|uniref:Uncharacterized protein n=1 Tax=Punica granatum TaxID=22663 RepID=A0A2I0JB77_PUNGR|nr:hypothetical protein CRG98_026421 [Punica granatum]